MLEKSECMIKNALKLFAKSPCPAGLGGGDCTIKCPKLFEMIIYSLAK